MMLEYSMSSRQVLAYFNATFIALIPKLDNPESFDQSRPISLCNSIYKIISNLIASRLKYLLAKNISSEQFGFLQGRQNHRAIGITQEGVHFIHTRKQ
jgi:hypothetical protein